MGKNEWRKFGALTVADIFLKVFSPTAPTF